MSAKEQGKKISRTSKQLKKETNSPYYLSNATGANPGGRINQDAYYKSRDLVEPIDPDLVEELALREQYNDPRLAPGGVGAYGRMSEIDPGILTKIGKQQLQQEKSLLGHMMGKWAIDSTRPEDQKRLADLDPVLHGQMQEGVKDIASFSMYLDKLLRKRMITTEEERLFVTSLLDPEVVIPTFPLWDPDGNVLGSVMWQSIMQTAAQRETKKMWGLFSKGITTGYGELGAFGANELPGQTGVQRAMKGMILLHLMPEFRREAVPGAPVNITLNAGNPTLNGAQVGSEATAFLTSYVNLGELPEMLNPRNGAVPGFKPAYDTGARTNVPSTPRRARNLRA
jgi:hypothetical protein